MIIYYTDRFEGGRGESRRLLKKALTVYTGDEERAKILIGALKEGEHGKPYIEGFSRFSVSHTGSIWAVLFADRECGLDIQFSRKCDIAAISGRFFDPEDAAKIASTEDFFRVWARREALIKALGSTIADPDLPAVLNEYAEAGGKRYFITDIELTDISRLYGAICVEGHSEESDPEICQL